jgi:hypothetical protein
MDTHEASEASLPEPDLQDIVSRWAGESRQLLLALPVVLAKLEELKEEREALRNRLMDLEQENLTLRESRENLAEIFAKLKDLISGTALDEAQRYLGLELVERASRAGADEPAANVEPALRDAVAEPQPPQLAVPDPAPATWPPKPPLHNATPVPSAPVRDVTPAPPPSSAPVRDITPAPPQSPVRDVTSMPPSKPPVREAALEPSSPKPEPQPEPVAHAAPTPPAAGPEPAPQATAEPVADKEKGAEPNEDKKPLRRVEPSPMRLASVFRPPTKK